MLPVHFYALVVVVGLVQGGTQALSRSLFTTMVPKTRRSEFFGFFSTGEKLAGIVGLALFGLVGELTGSSRWGIISVVFLFVTGPLQKFCRRSCRAMKILQPMARAKFSQLTRIPSEIREADINQKTVGANEAASKATLSRRRNLL